MTKRENEKFRNGDSVSQGYDIIKVGNSITTQNNDSEVSCLYNSWKLVSENQRFCCDFEKLTKWRLSITCSASGASVVLRNLVSYEYSYHRL